jgi:hypothetical protein
MSIECLVNQKRLLENKIEKIKKKIKKQKEYERREIEEAEEYGDEEYGDSEYEDSEYENEDEDEEILHANNVSINLKRKKIIIFF